MIKRVEEVGFMKFLILFLITNLFIQFNSTLEAKTLKNSRPNIILVLTDDQGIGDLSCMGNPILKTPNLDKFYQQSTRFTDFQVSPTCSPTRAAMMSGRHPMEVGVTHTIIQRERMALDVTTFPQVLQKSGYKTGLFGKWHLGDEKAYLPQNRGFDEVLMHGAGGIGQYVWGDFEANTINTYFDNVFLHNDTIVKTKGYCTDTFFGSALSWIRKQHKEEKKYFAYISLNAPHGPMIAPESYKKRFLKQGYDEKTAARYGMIENIDDNFGAMFEKLKTWGVLENTLIIFMTDNGMGMGKIKKNKKTKPAYNANMKGSKNSVWEGGTHVPAFWYWKDVLPQGKDINKLTAHIDLYRTFCDLAGAEVPQSKLTPTGKSLLPLLENSNNNWANRTLFFHKGRWDDNRKNYKSRKDNKYNGAAVRTDKWRLVFNTSKNKLNIHLSDINSDPGEKHNLAKKYPEVVKNLRLKYDQWWNSLDPYLVNEGLPHLTPEKQPFPILYKKQISDGTISKWSPNE